MSRKVTKQHQTFEEIKQVNEHDSEYWMARKLAKVLGYSEFRNFLPVIEKAKTACRKSGQAVSDHFVEMNEMVDIGSGARREMDSLALSRYACYLIVQNGDSSKPVIANGHFNAADRWAGHPLRIGLPAAVLAAIAGGTAFADCPVVAGSLAILSTALTTILTFLKPSGLLTAGGG
ncbi:MAG: hypothetical protein KZQ86_05570 [Candidatus Thiodiazotropha sp. (ex Lucinoma kastoroae)]|nr:hypothetical protein [Candidatus Thiodiazotropha sp. (ex Lucinoma kastoroae)]